MDEKREVGRVIDETGALVSKCDRVPTRLKHDVLSAGGIDENPAGGRQLAQIHIWSLLGISRHTVRGPATSRADDRRAKKLRAMLAEAFGSAKGAQRPILRSLLAFENL